MCEKPKILITFSENIDIAGGPYQSHKRIIESQLKTSYNFIPLYVPRVRKLLSFKGMKDFVKLIKKQEPDIVHFTGLQTDGFLVSLACRIAKVKKTVMAIRGSSNEAVYFAKWKKIIVNFLEKQTLKNVSVYYCVSNYVSSWRIIDKNSQKFRGVIYNLPHEYYEKSDEISFREEMGIDEESILIVSTGRITREKGYDILLRVIRDSKFNSLVKFIIVGEGSYLKQMKKVIAESGLNEKTIFLGYRKDIGKILSDCDIFILLSLHETLCNSIIEAGQQSLPSIATNVGGIPEIIKSGYNGFLVEKYDVKETISFLEFLVTKKENRKIMGENAKKSVETKFSYSIILSQIDKIYKELLFNG